MVIEAEMGQYITLKPSRLKFFKGLFLLDHMDVSTCLKPKRVEGKTTAHHSLLR